MKNIALFVLATLSYSLSFSTPSFPLYTGGNSWALDKNGRNDNANYSFNALPASFATYFYTSSSNIPFNLSIQLNSSVPTNITVSVGSISKTISVPANSNFAILNVGQFQSWTGYNKILTTISGVSTTGKGKISQFSVSGNLASLTYVQNNLDSGFYWGRRGSSCHLTYNVGTSKKISYFYNQIHVPLAFDKIGSYFMANGFAEGYFGIQVNSVTQRRVLFSVWSGYNTNNPSEIPAQYTVKVNRIGPGVTNGTFGGEGSGAQTYLVFNWVANRTYKFLTKVEPLTTNATKYTSWFNDPTNTTSEGWRLIAQITRPKIQTYLVRPHSFIENFYPDEGDKIRMAHYGNQWYYDQTSTWKQSTSAYYTKDTAGNTNQRRDVEGGVENQNMFFLKNTGFFNKTSIQGTTYTRTANKIPPKINFSTLP